MKTVLAATLILPVATLWMAAQSTQKKNDPNIAIKKRLHDFINLVDSTDFDVKVNNQSVVSHEQVLATRDKARRLLSEWV